MSQIGFYSVFLVFFSFKVLLTATEPVGKSEVKKWNCSTVITLTDKFGWINSPNYPDKYENNTECLWLIKPLQNNFIQLNIHQFQLEKGIKSYKINKLSQTRHVRCPFDFLYIFETNAMALTRSDGYQPQTEKKSNWGTFCGSQTNFQALTRTPGSILHLYFHSDSTKQFGGFNISYRQITIFDAKKIEDINLENKFVKSHHDLAMKEKQTLQLMVLIITIMLFCIIGIVSIIRTCPFFNNSEHDEQTTGLFQFYFGRSQLNRSNNALLHQPTPPPSYSDVVKTEEDWNEVARQLGEECTRELQQRQAADQVRVIYNLSESSSGSSISDSSNCSVLISSVNRRLRQNQINVQGHQIKTREIEE